MEYQAIAKYIKISPRKVRLVADAVRELSIDDAKNSLGNINNRAAGPLLKVLNSAVANAVNNGNADKINLNIKAINITEGVRYKRYHYAGRGRVRPYVRRTSHINVIVVDSKPEATAISSEKVANKQIKEKKEASKK